MNTSRIELLTKENFDTWKLQMQAVLTKCDLWEYTNGSNVQPTLKADNSNAAAVSEWVKNDQKAKSEIILSISPTELRQVKNCVTSREMWCRLDQIYQSKGPARKATLLKNLILCKMDDAGDIHEHLNAFFTSVDKLAEMEINVNPDLLAILMLYSLPSTFDNFRCAIESRDDLPEPEALRIKIIEECNARRNNLNGKSSGAMIANKGGPRDYRRKHTNHRANGERNGKKDTELRCFKCNRVGHRAANCPSKEKHDSEKFAKNVCLKLSQDVTGKPDYWCLDSGATSHMCNKLTKFHETKCTKPGKLNLANNSSTETKGEGSVMFVADVHGEKTYVSLESTLKVPDLRSNLLSVSKITDRGYEVRFKQNEAVVTDSNGNIHLCADRVGDLYFVRGSLNEARVACLSQKKTKAPIELLHRRLGHTNTQDIINAIRSGRVTGIETKRPADRIICSICLQGKMTKTPFPKLSNRQTSTLEIIHTDVCGPMRSQSLGGARYYIEFIDDATKWCEVRFLRSKADVAKITIEYIAFVEKQKGGRVKCLQSDNGTEYTTRELEEYLKTRGISRRLTAPYNPQQNGTSERKNRTLLDTARCLLVESKLPQSFWAEAVNTANYIRNRLPTSSLNGRTPYEAWTGKPPDLSHCRVFGTRVIYLNTEPGKGKFDERGHEGIFLGYPDDSKAFRIWSSKKHKVLITRDVKFLEDDGNIIDISSAAENLENSSSNRQYVDVEFPLSQENNPSDENKHETYKDNLSLDNAMSTPRTTEDEEEEDFLGFDTTEDESTKERITKAPGRPKIGRTGRRGRPRKLFQKRRHITERDDSDHTEGREVDDLAECSLLSEISMNEAMTGNDADDWRQAIAIELTSILKNDTFDLVDRPKRSKVIGSRIILRNKFKPDGSLERRKARLVAQGFSQKPGIHFTETFAPVTRFSSIRMMVSLAVEHGMKIKHFDVTTAYLNSEIMEEIYMEPPIDFEQFLKQIIRRENDSSTRKRAERMLHEIQTGDKVCRLKKSLYGLKQAGRSWYEKLNSTLKEIGAIPTASDPCFFHLDSGEDKTFIAVYVDDILVASRNQKMISKVERLLSSKFDLKNLGDVKNCLGVEFDQGNGRITMHQRRYITEILSRFGMSECKPVATPADPNTKLLKGGEQDSEDAKLPYRELIGALTYLAMTTRPDIAFVVSQLGQFNNCYREEHWKAAKRVLRYLKGSIQLGLSYEAAHSPIRAYVDADWGNCTEDRRSFTGYVFMLNGSPVSWDTKKQRTVALSTTEAEYMAMAECAKEAIYLQRFMRELGFNELSDLTIHCDNLSAVRLAENPVFHSRSKHIDVRHHFVRDVLRDKQIAVKHIPTEQQVADFLTKGLAKQKHEWCVNAAGLRIINDRGLKN